MHDIKTALDREFVTLFSGHSRPSWDTSNLTIDDEMFHEVGSMMSTAEAAELLQKIDVANYRQAWWLLKYMTRHKDFRLEVLMHYHAKREP